MNIACGDTNNYAWKRWSLSRLALSSQRNLICVELPHKKIQTHEIGLNLAYKHIYAQINVNTGSEPRVFLEFIFLRKYKHTEINQTSKHKQINLNTVNCFSRIYISHTPVRKLCFTLDGQSTEELHQSLIESSYVTNNYFLICGQMTIRGGFFWNLYFSHIVAFTRGEIWYMSLIL